MSFNFKQFKIDHDQCAFKVGTDGVLLGAWVNVEGVTLALDIGTGSGLIAMMLAQRNLDLNIEAVEFDEASFVQAHQNMQNCLWKNRLSIFHQRIQDFGKEKQERFDLIVSNPPYFNDGTVAPKITKHNARHTATLSHEELLKTVVFLLHPKGKFSVVLPYEEGTVFQKLAKTHQLFCTKEVAVQSMPNKPIERLLMQFEKVESLTKASNLIIQNTKLRHDYTKEYVALTNGFYTIM